MEKLISFHFSLIPFFESKQESDTFLKYGECDVSATVSPVVEEEDERDRNLDTIFVKTIFPFIERRECD